ncbi:MAG: sigma-70 family RNA polymerase sigma factor [Leptolyngbyaceae cyanobacterium MO_188.B28]|nr:sigma-70 family RNA polymerase sigma factor [Leptolyngbyaceae cyanobacterium MO_188.B28]
MPTPPPQLNIHRRQSQNQYYEETLAEGVALRMMQIPAGKFLMGSPEDELERSDAEGPQHVVTVPQFFMAKYSVTQAQWRAVAALPRVEQKFDPDPARFKGEDRPVERLSWNDAVEFCDRLTLHTNRQYRLPTEAEWEYACRAGTITPFHFGETLSTAYANYDGSNEEYGTYGPGVRGEWREQTTPIDHFEGVNEYGLSDMHGNVFEWCQDNWRDNYYDAPIDGSAWLSSNESKFYILRGGSWLSFPGYCRSASRGYHEPGDRDYDIGFRVCCSALRTKQATYINPTEKLGGISDAVIELIIAQEEAQEKNILKVQLQQTLISALSQLDRQTQQLLELYYARGVSQRDIAEQMELKQYTVSRRLSKSREKLIAAILKWSQTQLQISLHSEQAGSVSKLLEEWLSIYYSTSR